MYYNHLGLQSLKLVLPRNSFLTSCNAGSVDNTSNAAGAPCRTASYRLDGADSDRIVSNAQSSPCTTVSPPPVHSPYTGILLQCRFAYTRSFSSCRLDCKYLHCTKTIPQQAGSHFLRTNFVQQTDSSDTFCLTNSLSSLYLVPTSPLCTVHPTNYKNRLYWRSLLLCGSTIGEAHPA